jgi:hypothetical protein
MLIMRERGSKARYTFGYMRNSFNKNNCTKERKAKMALICGFNPAGDDATAVIPIQDDQHRDRWLNVTVPEFFRSPGHSSPREVNQLGPDTFEVIWSEIGRSESVICNAS